MSNDDLIKRGDALEICTAYGFSRADECRDGIAALPAVSAPVAVRVKPLKWLAIDDDDCDFEAYSVGLRYWIVAVTDHQFTLYCGPLVIKYCLTLDAAKAAAQQDYAARIMAAIDAPDVAELVEAAKGVMRHMPDYADTAWQALDAALARIGGHS